MLVDASGLAAAKRPAPPVLLVHGRMDEVVPYAALAEAEQGLKAAGIAVTSLTCPGLGHSIDNAGMAAGLKFVSQAFAAAG
jgi:phospholipase/carboxylesterase